MESMFVISSFSFGNHNWTSKTFHIEWKNVALEAIFIISHFHLRLNSMRFFSSIYFKMISSLPFLCLSLSLSIHCITYFSFTEFIILMMNSKLRNSPRAENISFSNSAAVFCYRFDSHHNNKGLMLKKFEKKIELMLMILSTYQHCFIKLIIWFR